MKIAHISDIHFFASTFHLKDLFSNKWIGHFNAKFRRKNLFITKFLDQLLASLIKESTDILIISGDLTSTSDKNEFALAKEFIEKVKDAGIKVFAIPGNHDNYTKKAYKEKSFYLLLDCLPTFSDGSVHLEKIDPNWNLVLLDNTIFNKRLKANGLFSLEHKSKLTKILKGVKNVIIANHFPLEDHKKSHSLLGSHMLKEILKEHKFPTIYLHGHTHKTSHSKQSPLLDIFNSSEVTVKNKYKYHLLDLNEKGFTHKEIQYFD
jgi:3',5'-cyclic AMP phosphodiesterase CpdA